MRTNLLRVYCLHLQVEQIPKVRFRLNISETMADMSNVNDMDVKVKLADSRTIIFNGNAKFMKSKSMPCLLIQVVKNFKSNPEHFFPTIRKNFKKRV